MRERDFARKKTESSTAHKILELIFDHASSSLLCDESELKQRTETFPAKICQNSLHTAHSRPQPSSSKGQREASTQAERRNDMKKNHLPINYFLVDFFDLVLETLALWPSEAKKLPEKHLTREKKEKTFRKNRCGGVWLLQHQFHDPNISSLFFR